jgi:tRNA A37 threonylcarbamoyladenosine synthetase subunit TsaC/SUA5/YrdC
MRQSQVLPASDPRSIRFAAEIIGSLVAFPTETVYGLGTNTLNPDAVTRIFEANSDRHFTLIVHITERTSLDLPVHAISPDD